LHRGHRVHHLFISPNCGRDDFGRDDCDRDVCDRSGGSSDSDDIGDSPPSVTFLRRSLGCGRCDFDDRGEPLLPFFSAGVGPVGPPACGPSLTTVTSAELSVPCALPSLGVKSSSIPLVS